VTSSGVDAGSNQLKTQIFPLLFKNYSSLLDHRDHIFGARCLPVQGYCSNMEGQQSNADYLEGDPNFTLMEHNLKKRAFKKEAFLFKDS